MIWALLQTQSTYKPRRKQRDKQTDFKVSWEFSYLVLFYFFFYLNNDCSYRRTPWYTSTRALFCVQEQITKNQDTKQNNNKNK